MLHHHIQTLILCENETHIYFGGAKASTGLGSVAVACRAPWQARKTPRKQLQVPTITSTSLSQLN